MQNIKNTVFLLLVLIGISTPLMAQNNTINIRVYDQNKVLVPYVGIKISPLSNPDEVKSSVIINYPYTIKNKNGKYLVVINKYGFQEYLDTITIGQENNEIDITLLPLGFGAEASTSKQISSDIKSVAGIVTIITNEEIQNMGARNLMDILQTVPGFSLGSDIKNTVGIGVRGIWANNARYLLMFNGVELNENIYGTAQVGSRISPDMIERIEITKGSGLVTNGEYGSLGIINIITRRTFGANNVEMAGGVGFSDSFMIRRDFAMNLSIPMNKDMTLSMNWSRANNVRSDRIYTDNSGSKTHFGNNSKLDNDFINLTLNYKGFLFNYFQENYDVESQDQIERLASKTYRMNHKVHVIYANKKIRLTERFSMFPRFFFKKSVAYNQLNTSFADNVLNNISNIDINSVRTGINSMLQYDINQKSNVQVGFDFHIDEAEQSTQLFYNRRNKLQTNTISPYFMYNASYGDINKSHFKLNAGGRYLDHNFTQGFSTIASLSFLTKSVFAKAQYSAPLTLPTTNDVDQNGFVNLGKINIVPETAQNLDIEFGYIKNGLHLSANLFDYRIANPYTYWIGTFNRPIIPNMEDIHSQGIEFIYKHNISEFIGLNINYSTYQSLGNDIVFKVKNTKANLALSQHKVYSSLNFNFSKFKMPLNINFNGTWYSKAYNQNANMNSATAIEYKPLLNFVAKYLNIGNSGMDFSFSMMNLLGSGYMLHQPYYGNHGALPTLGREYYMKMSYIIGGKTTKKLLK